MKRLVLACACLAAGLLAQPAGMSPALAYDQRNGDIPNHMMPFPRLMNSLFGPERQPAVRDPRNQARLNHAPQRQGQAVQVRPSQQRALRSQNSRRQSTLIHRAAAPTARAARHSIAPHLLPQIVSYNSSQKPGTIIIDTNARYLYLVLPNGQARRYGVGVGRPGFEWAGTHRVTRKAEWPSWTPPETMKARARAQGQILPDFMPGGPDNPMGARALYLGSTLYRIHGSNEPWTIGQAVSSGCIRMRNEDVIDLYGRVPVGAKVIVI